MIVSFYCDLKLYFELIAIVIAELILQPFRHLTYVTAHFPTLTSLYLRHSSFSKPSVASPTSQLILRHFFRFSYVTGSSPDEPPMSHTHSNKGDMSRMIMIAKCIRGPGRFKFSWHLSYRWGKTPKKPSPRKLVPIGDRIWAHCLTDAQCTACSIMDNNIN